MYTAQWGQLDSKKFKNPALYLAGTMKIKNLARDLIWPEIMKNKNYVNMKFSSRRHFGTNSRYFPALRGIRTVIVPHISPVLPHPSPWVGVCVCVGGGGGGAGGDSR